MGDLEQWIGIILKTSLKPMTDARETRTKNSHEIEQALFDARNYREKYLAASRYDTRTSFSLARVSRTCVMGFKQWWAQLMEKFASITDDPLMKC